MRKIMTWRRRRFGEGWAIIINVLLRWNIVKNIELHVFSSKHWLKIENEIVTVNEEDYDQEEIMRRRRIGEGWAIIINVLLRWNIVKNIELHVFSSKHWLKIENGINKVVIVNAEEDYDQEEEDIWGNYGDNDPDSEYWMLLWYTQGLPWSFILLLNLCKVFFLACVKFCQSFSVYEAYIQVLHQQCSKIE